MPAVCKVIRSTGLRKVTRHISPTVQTATERKKTERDWMRDGEGGKETRSEIET